jgi:hypothetical protein
MEFLSRVIFGAASAILMLLAESKAISNAQTVWFRGGKFMRGV